MGNITVQSNTALYSCCDLFPLFDGSATVSGSTRLSSNATGCNTIIEIANACQGPFTINSDVDIPGNVADLTRIVGDLTIGGTITTFPNFAALTAVEGNLTISGITTGALTSLDGIFPVLDSIRGDLVIQNHAVVQRITGFVTLDSIGRDLNINNTSLTTLPAFDALTRIGNDFFIQNNAVLATVEGFESLKSIGNNFIANDNIKLSSCCGLVRLVDDTATPGGTTTVARNVAGCNSVDDIKANCIRTLTASPSPLNVTAGCRKGYLQCHGQCALEDHPSVPRQLD